MTVTGSGFGDEVEVTIGGNDCDVIASDYTEITCVAPSGVSNINVFLLGGSLN